MRKWSVTILLFTREEVTSMHDFVPCVFLGYTCHTWEHVHAVLSDKKLVTAKGCAFVNKLSPTSSRVESVFEENVDKDLNNQ